jgi:hypothetical protein
VSAWATRRCQGQCLTCPTPRRTSHGPINCLHHNRLSLLMPLSRLLFWEARRPQSMSRAHLPEGTSTPRVYSAAVHSRFSHRQWYPLSTMLKSSSMKSLNGLCSRQNFGVEEHTIGFHDGRTKENDWVARSNPNQSIAPRASPASTAR